MPGRASRNKGKRGEREVAAEFKEYGFDARRGWQSRDGADEPDVIVPAFNLWIEVKRGKRPNIAAAMRQARAASDAGGQVPLVCTRADGEGWLATLDLTQLLIVLSELPREEQ